MTVFWGQEVTDMVEEVDTEFGDNGIVTELTGVTGYRQYAPQ